jgi:CheY-like chemotaxis protein
MVDAVTKKEFEIAYTNLKNNQTSTSYNHLLRLAEKFKKEKSARAAILYFLAAECKRMEGKDNRDEFIESAKQYLRLAKESNRESKSAFLCASKCFIKAGQYDDAKKSLESYKKDSITEIEESQRAVFIVEDSASMAYKIKNTLEALDYKNIQVFNTANAFLRVFKSAGKTNQNPIILLDMGLPDINGHEVAKKILDVDPRISIILITAYERSSDLVREAISDGISAFIQKPFSVDDLRKALEKVELEDVLLKKEK